MNNRMTAADFRKKYAPTNPGNQVINQTKNEANSHTPVSNTKPKHHKAPALGAAGSGEEKSIQRTTVRFTGYRVRPLDPDNFAGSVKDCLDGLRHAQIISGDEPWRIILETEQVKVGSYKEEKTVIEIDDSNIE
jgi:hypothetical protein